MLTHEDDENFLSKSYADDLYPSSDAIVAMFNQELTNREKETLEQEHMIKICSKMLESLMSLCTDQML